MAEDQGATGRWLRRITDTLSGEPRDIEGLIETFRKLVEEGLHILLIEQNLAVATALAERQLIMIAGEVAAETTAGELSASPELQRRYLGVEPVEHE